VGVRGRRLQVIVLRSVPSSPHSTRPQATIEEVDAENCVRVAGSDHVINVFFQFDTVNQIV
jgi:hypothetical protein